MRTITVKISLPRLQEEVEIPDDLSETRAYEYAHNVARERLMDDLREANNAEFLYKKAFFWAAPMVTE